MANDELRGFAEWEAPNLGTAWKDGKLYLFTRCFVTVARPDGARSTAWFRSEESGGFQGTLDPPFCLDERQASVRPVRTAIRADADRKARRARAAALSARSWASFFAAIERDVGGHDPLEIARRFSDRQWACLVAGLKGGVGALELADSNPALYFAAVASRRLGLRRSHHCRWLLSVIRQPRKDLARALGFVPPAGSGFGTAWAVRVLRAVPAGTATVPRLYCLRQTILSDGAVCDRGRKALAHLAGAGRPLRAGVLRVVTDVELLPHFTQACLESLSELPDDRSTLRAAYKAQEILRSREQRPELWRRLLLFRSVSEIDAAYRRMIELGARPGWHPDERPIDPDEPLPRHPFDLSTDHPGAAEEQAVEWTGLDTYDLIKSEGRAMSHCCPTYLKRVRAGEYALAHVRLLDGEEEVTVGLRKVVSGAWSIDEIYGVGNAPPSPRIRREVVRIVKACQPGAALDADGRGVGPEDRVVFFSFEIRA